METILNKIFRMKTWIHILFTGMVVLFASLTLHAQIDIEGKIRQKVLDRAEQHVDEGIDKVLDATEEGIEESIKNEGNDEQGETDEKPKQEESDEAQPEDEPTKLSSQKNSQKPSLAVYSKYDFIAGETVILFEDFSQDFVGEFPALWNTNATGEVMTASLFDGKWFKLLGNGVYLLEKEIAFPDNYTIEFEAIPQYKEEAGNCDFTLTIYADPSSGLNDELYPGEAGYHLTFSDLGHSYLNYCQQSDNYGQISGSSETGLLVPEELNKIRIWVQRQRIRVYIEEKKIFDLPRGVLAGYKYNHLRFSIWDKGGEPLISNIRIAAGRPDMRSKLLTEGRLISYGIYFDPGKDDVKPESHATIKEIAAVLQENPAVRIFIIGHTDSDGYENDNRVLSKNRALSVRNYLHNIFNIDLSRMETDGKGESEPVSSNSSSVGKALNRRVEFIKQ